MATRTYRRQPRGEWTRLPRASALIPQIDRCLQRSKRLSGQSVSWIVADILADYFGIPDQVRFGETAARRKNRKSARAA